MLSQKTLSIIKATVPVLEAHGETLTRHFYKRMFAHNPEVIAFFNPAHQASGTQQRALANAICAYAANIDNLGVLGNAVELIAQKHASLQIKPEQYPIVGSNLLESIREVLGEGATDEVINAWSEAYGLLAEILIGREAQLYKEQSETPHGWDGFKQFKVIKKEKESDLITSFYLVPANNEALPDFKPGQYITVRVPTPCGHTTMRNYSLSDRPGRGYYRISVKRELSTNAEAPSGYVSNKLHDHVEAGSLLEVAPPCGEFYIDSNADDSRPLILLAGGVGVTPLLSMLYAALENTPAREIIFIHACPHEKAQAFKVVLDGLAAEHESLRVFHCYSEPAPEGIVRSERALNGLVTHSLVEHHAYKSDGEYYFCGPKPFMVDIYHHLLELGVPSKQMHYEFFGPNETM
jgi:nitric oxide dioxygenase